MQGSLIQADKKKSKFDKSRQLAKAVIRSTSVLQENTKTSQ